MSYLSDNWRKYRHLFLGLPKKQVLEIFSNREVTVRKRELELCRALFKRRELSSFEVVFLLVFKKAKDHINDVMRKGKRGDKLLDDLDAFLIREKRSDTRPFFSRRHSVDHAELSELIRPEQLIWEITGRCESKCPHCLASRFPRKDLDLKQVQRAFGTMGRFGRIVISGGEPSLHPDFKKFVLFASKLANSVEVNTNVEWLSSNPRKAVEQLRWLPENCELMVSFDYYHFGEITPEIEAKIKSLIKAVRRTKHRLILNNVGPRRDFPKVKDPELRGLLERIKKEKVKGIDARFTGKPTAKARALALPVHAVEKYRMDEILENYVLSDAYFEVSPDGRVFHGDWPLVSSSRAKDPPLYLGDISKEKFTTMYHRFVRRVTLSPIRLTQQRTREELRTRSKSLYLRVAKDPKAIRRFVTLLGSGDGESEETQKRVTKLTRRMRARMTDKKAAVKRQRKLAAEMRKRFPRSIRK